MGFLKSLIGAAAPIVGGMFGGPIGSAIGGAIGGALDSKGQPKQQTATTTQQLDPRAQAMLWGEGGNKGLLSHYQSLLTTPQSAAATGFAGANADYLTQYGGQDMSAIRGAATSLMKGNAAPTTVGAATTLPAYLTPTKINAPSQNGLDLKGSYDRFVNGTPGSNPHLKASIQGGIDMSKLGFEQMQSSATENLMENIMPSIRSNSVLAGQYGGSRQGIAEGNAIGDHQKAMQQAAAAFGQNNTNAAVGAQASAYETDSNRALAATQGLGAQQYGVASQDAQMKQQADALNVNNVFDAAKMNAGLTQQTQLANQSAQLQTNAQNNGSLLAGAGMLGNLTGQAAGVVNAQDNQALGRAQGVNSLLAPYLGLGRTTTESQPLYQSTAGNAASGLFNGLNLYDMFTKAGK